MKLRESGANKCDIAKFMRLRTTSRAAILVYKISDKHEEINKTHIKQSRSTLNLTQGTLVKILRSAFMTVGQTDGWTDGWTDKWTDKVTCRVAEHTTKKEMTQSIFIDLF